MKHVLSISDFSREKIEEIIAQAALMRELNSKGQQPRQLIHSDGSLPHRLKTTLLFVEPSTRTCYSYEEAAKKCGFDTTVLTDREMTSLKKGETLADTCRMLAGQGANVLVLRTPLEGSARFVAEILDASGYNVVVQNAGDGANQHPTQALLDLFTIHQLLGRLDNFTFGAVGDLRYSRVIHSTLQGLAKFKNIKVRLVSMPETRLPDHYKSDFSEITEGDSMDLLKDCDIIEALRIQEERFTDPAELERVRGKYVINRDVLDHALKPSVFILHPLPRREEIHPEISNDPRIKIFFQADMGIPLRMALLYTGMANCLAEMKTLPPEDRPIEWEDLVNEPIEQHLARRQKEGKYFRPISNGVVIDHLPHHLTLVLRRLLESTLRKSNRVVIHLIEGVPSSRHGFKDVMVLENGFLLDDVSAAIAFLAPDATFNLLFGETFKKIRIKRMPSMIRELFRCPNPVCITNHEPEAKTSFLPHGNFAVECRYCNRVFSRDEIIKALKK